MNNIQIEKTKEVYEIRHIAEKRERPILAQVTIEVKDASITIEKINNSGGHPVGRDWHFEKSKPEIVRAVGEILIAAAQASQNYTNI